MSNTHLDSEAGLRRTAERIAFFCSSNPIEQRSEADGCRTHIWAFRWAAIRHLDRSNLAALLVGSLCRTHKSAGDWWPRS